MSFKSLALALMVTLLVTACAPMPATTASPAALRAEVTSFMEAYNAALTSRDAARIRSFYVADDRFVWIEEGKVRYRSADEVLAGLAQVPAATVIRTELKNIGAAAIGPASAHAWAEFRTSFGEGPGAFTFGGMLSMTLERQGSTWKIVGGHSSAQGRR